MNIENISKRQNSKLIDINERTFKINKFDPLMGNYIYGIIDFNSQIAMQLLIVTITFNYSDFFGENGLSSLLDNTK